MSDPRDQVRHGAVMRNSIRATGLVVAGLIVAAFWPLALLPIGIGSAAAAAWLYRGQRRLAMPYIVAGGLLVATLPTLLLLLPASTETTLLPPNPIRTVR